MTNDELLIFAEDSADEAIYQESYKILILDDEPDVHDLTRLVLKDFTFNGKIFNLHNAYSALEGKEWLLNNSDVALILLDVVMESENAGLELVKYIREELNNRLVRIILRTGQPGQAPEQKVIVDYDINDYKEKTELSSQKLITSVLAALRSYDSLLALLTMNEQLEDKIVQRTKEIREKNFELRTTLNRLEEDEKAGKRIQFKLLPPTDKTINGYDFSHHLIPSRFLSGDFVDYFNIDDNSVGFYVADVSGHGVSSAFVTLLLKNFVSSLLEKHKTLNDAVILNPSKLLKKFNEELIRENMEKYVTLFYGVIDKSKNVLTYSNAGQFPYPVMYSNKTQLIDKRGVPVGMFEFSEYRDEIISLPDKFMLFIFSDGILELLPKLSLKKKIETLSSLINNNNNNIPKILIALENENKSFPPDDVAILMVRK